MDAVVALYSDGDAELSEAIIASLSCAVFGPGSVTRAGLPQKLFSRFTHQVLKLTTKRRKADDQSGDTSTYCNPILERSGHPYARALLTSSSTAEKSVIEGGDHMNGPYMMIVPEILKLGTTWDRIFLNSVQGKDVQLRFIWETKATYQEAKVRLDKGQNVRIKAVAAGTGLSMILAYDRLMRDGYDPARITARITDREKSNTEKSRRILAKLSTTRGGEASDSSGGGISAETEDIFGEMPGSESEAAYDVVTAVGILEYFQGFTCQTTERSLDLSQPEEEAHAVHLAQKLSQMTADDGSLITNTCRPQASTRILELFGKRFDYRTRTNLSELLRTVKFRNPRLMGTGNIYDVKVYEKGPH